MTQDLLPLAAYSLRFSALRMALALAILWGVPMTFLLALSGGVPLRVVVGAGVGASLLFGGLGTLLFSQAMRYLVCRLYLGDPKLVPPPPGDGYVTRVLAGFMTSPRFAVGGHLYAGPPGLAFVPHLRNRSDDRAPRVLPWDRVARVEPLPGQSSALARVTSVQPLPLLRVITTDGEWHFRVPEAQRVGLELEKYLCPKPSGIS